MRQIAPTNSRSVEIAGKVAHLQRYLSTDFLGGPRPFTLSAVINFQKGGTALFVAALMWLYQNSTTPAWVYLALHGSYGICWLLKDRAFPDRRWETKVTLGGAFMTFALVLGPYWVLPFLLVSNVLGPNHPPPSVPLMALCIALHTLGVALMLSADCQKHFSLALAPGLITTGMYRRIRYPNYLGEMMIYGAYGLMVRHWIGWAILAWVWLAVFLVNMIATDQSLSRYPGWPEYAARTGRILPRLRPGN